MAEVSTEALKNVKQALRSFRTDISGMSLRAVDSSAGIMKDCESRVKQVAGEIDRLDAQIAALERQISALDDRIAQAASEHRTLTASIPQMQSRVRSLQAALSASRSQLAALRAQLSDCEDDDTRQQIQAQIAQLEQQIARREEELRQLQTALRGAEQKRVELQQAIDAAKSQKLNCETEASAQKRRRNQRKDQHERLKTACSRLKSDLEVYVSATKKFEGSASNQAQQNASAIEQCIRSIEQYFSVSLSASPSQRNTTRNTAPESAQLREMERSGELDVSAVDLVNATRAASGSCLTETPMQVTLPANTSHYSMESFAEQVLWQEDGLNCLSVYDFLTNYENRRSNGRDSHSAAEQANYRQALVETIMDEILAENPGTDSADARRDAESCASIMAALHNPDQIAGGSGFGVTAAGARNINSALGSLWAHGRAAALYRQVLEASEGMTEEQMRNTHLNVRLIVQERS